MRTTYLSWATGFISGLNYVGSMLFIFLVVCIVFLFSYVFLLCLVPYVVCGLCILDCLFGVLTRLFTKNNEIMWSFWWYICEASDWESTQVRVDRTLWCLPFFFRCCPPLFFNIDFFSYKQHFATFYVSLYCIYCRYVILLCQKTGMDRNYCLIVFIVYMSYSDT